MGQQQLLLIVLGVIIVGIAIVVGINLFNANAEESAKDTAVSEGTNLGALAQQYFKKPVALGGGGNNFVGFTVPPQLAASSLLGGTWLASAASPTQVTITLSGINTASLGYSFTGVTVLVTPNAITSTINLL